MDAVFVLDWYLLDPRISIGDPVPAPAVLQGCPRLTTDKSHSVGRDKLGVCPGWRYLPLSGRRYLPLPGKLLN